MAGDAKGASPAAPSDVFNLLADEFAGLRGREPCPATRRDVHVPLFALRHNDDLA
jgi:hypothetical protein